MTKVIPEELMRRARITQGLPPDPVFTLPTYTEHQIKRQTARAQARAERLRRWEVEKAVNTELRAKRIAEKAAQAQERAFEIEAREARSMAYAQARARELEAYAQARARAREAEATAQAQAEAEKTGHVGFKFGELTLIMEYLPGHYRCLCGACRGVHSFTWAELGRRMNPTCGCVPRVVRRGRPKGKSTPEERAARERMVRERQYALNKSIVKLSDLEGPSGTPDFRTFHLRTSDWLGEGCRWVRSGGWPLDWERAW
jgi:hypothetical protein